jgi:hypothetical protein
MRSYAASPPWRLHGGSGATSLYKPLLSGLTAHSHKLLSLSFVVPVLNTTRYLELRGSLTETHSLQNMELEFVLRQ